MRWIVTCPSRYQNKKKTEKLFLKGEKSFIILKDNVNQNSFVRTLNCEQVVIQ